MSLNCFFQFRHDNLLITIPDLEKNDNKYILHSHWEGKEQSNTAYFPRYFGKHPGYRFPGDVVIGDPILYKSGKHNINSSII